MGATGAADSLWYKDAIIYELHVRAFADSNDDGIGDFCGLTGKLDYLQDLGVTAIWLLPFYPSPLLDDGYDIADYTDVHPSYGTLHDFKVFLKAAHERGLKVITELVLNHTSDQHPWFQRSRRAKPGSAWRDFYVWSDDSERYGDARIIFQDFERSNWTWDAVANAYFWHRFYSHQPDLNFDNPRVRNEILKVVDFWLRLGVDGLRLDAVPYLFEREGTTGENLPQTHAALRELRRHIDEHFENRMLLAEANQWPEDAVTYFGRGDECHMAFHFPLMPRLFMAVRMEDRFPIVDILDQTPPIPETAQWALFLRNHDELTLEMVTEEERVYMYRTFARDTEARINLGIRRRLAPLLRNNRHTIELLNGLLCALPGTPVIYYGDEIGMGDNIYLGDRNGVRTPMQWSADRNAGFSNANPQQLYLPLVVDHEYHHEMVQVEAQQRNSSSLLWWMKRLIALRKRYRAFGRGSIQILAPDNRKVLAFIRSYENEQILVVANLSRFLQHVELDLSAFRGCVPVELFGRTALPPVGELPYLLTLGPHAFNWFALEPRRTRRPRDQPYEIPSLAVEGGWKTLVQGRERGALEMALPEYLRGRNWFTGKHRTILSALIKETIPMPSGDDMAILTLISVHYADEEPRDYVVPFAYAAGKQAKKIEEEHPHLIVARVSERGAKEEGILYDAMWSESFASNLLDATLHRRQFAGMAGTAAFVPLPGIRKLLPRGKAALPAKALHARHNNTAIVYGDQLIFKLFRCVDEGVNPELEIGRWLTERGFTHTPQVVGAVEYRSAQNGPLTLGVLQAFVPSRGELWGYVQEQLAAFFDRAPDDLSADESDSASALIDLAGQEAPDQARKLIGPLLDRARLLGQRTAELHLALADDGEDPRFKPHPMTPLYQRSLYQSIRSLAGLVFDDLRRRIGDLPAAAQGDARTVLESEHDILERARAITAQPIDAVRIRCHGDYHLGQVLDTGDDFVMFDFEGEPERPVLERQLKRPAFDDIASMLRSFHSATVAARLARAGDTKDAWATVVALDAAARFWLRWTGAAFLEGYLAMAGAAPFVPQSREAQALLLDVLRLERAIQVLSYELRNRPERVRAALDGVQHALGKAPQ